MADERNFASPHVHPMSLDTGSTVESFADREEELGTGAITATDHGSLAACRMVYDVARERKLTPILGCEFYFRDDDCTILLGAGAQKNKDGKLVDFVKYMHGTVHALDQPSYERLGALLSHADARAEQHGQERKPLFSWKEMEEIGGLNVTLGSGCLIGMVQRHLLERDDAATAVAYYERLRGLARPGHFYVEAFPHDCSRNYTKAVFLTLEDGRKLRYHFDKNLRTTEGETTAEALAFRKVRGKLLAVKHYRKWEDEASPVEIVSVDKVEGFVENQCRPWCNTTDVQAGTNRFMLAMARRYGDPVLVSDDAHYAHPDDKIVQDVRLAQSGPWRFYGSYHRQSSEDAFAYFGARMGVPRAEFDSWVENNAAWAARFKDFRFEYKPSLPAKFYPEDTVSYMTELINRHGRMRWDDQRYKARLRAEVEMLHLNGTIDLLPYFFLAEEACRQYADQGELTGVGRGSAAGLLLAYLLGITHMDPIRYELSLERFITLDRIKSGSLPDIDLDFPGRELLTREGGWLDKRFGAHYAQISVDTTLRLRNAAKDVARLTRGHVPPQVEALTKKFAQPPQNVDDKDFVFGYESDDGTQVKGSIETDEALRQYIREFPREWGILQKCLGLARNKGRHAAGFVIANRPIHEFIPLTSVSGHKVTQYTAPSVEACGGVKMDFLVINSLKDIGAAVRLVQQRAGVGIPKEGATIDGIHVPAHRLVPFRGRLYDVWDLPEDDAVFTDTLKGRTETVFQLDTPGATGWLKKFDHLRPDGRPLICSVLDGAAFTALDRPGALDVELKNPEGGPPHNALVEYARRARGLAPSPDVPSFLSELFPETHGVMVYQEQLQRAYQHLTGCSGPEAEEFRRNVAKKKMDKVEKAFPFFLAGASAKLGEENARGVWKFFITWAKYGFNKSHAACYALTGYVCAFMKHHYPLEWWCAVLRNAHKDEVCVQFWPFCGHLVDLPDLSRLSNVFEIHGDRIVAPVSLLHGIGEKAHGQILRYAPYSDLNDFCAKIVRHKKDTGAYVASEVVDKKTKQTKVELKFRGGHSSIHRGVVHNLIVSGTMDSILPEAVRGGTMLDKLDAFEAAMEAAGEKPERVPGWYAQVGPLARYLLRRAILPAYSEDLRPVLLQVGYKGVSKTPDGWFWEGQTMLADARDMRAIDELPFIPEGGLQVVVVGHVLEVRNFPTRRGPARELHLDISGERVKVVAWSRNGELPKRVSAAGDVADAIVLVGLSKFRAGKSFMIDWVQVAQEQVEKAKERWNVEEAKRKDDSKRGPKGRKADQDGPGRLPGGDKGRVGGKGELRQGGPAVPQG